MGKQIELNSEAVSAWQNVVNAAMTCFRRSGYAAATMSDIAAEAGLPLAAVRRCFPGKEALALALVQAKIDELAAYIDSLAAGAMADRYSQTLSFALRTLSQDRDVVTAVFASAMVDGAEFDLMSGLSAQRLTAAMERLVLQSDDALREQQARDMGAALYTALMLILVFWCYDRSPGQAVTGDLLGLVCDLFAQVRPLYFLPMAPQAIARLAAIVQPLTEPASVGAAAQKDARDSEHQYLDVHRD